MPSSGTLSRVALVRTDVLEEHTTSVAHIVFLRSVRRLPVTANVVPSSPIFVTLMMEALRSSETSVLTRATWRNIPEDGILHSHHCDNLKCYKEVICQQTLNRAFELNGLFAITQMAAPHLKEM
jgi:hypothetical protein